MTCESPQISCFPISNGCVSTYPLPLLFWLELQCREHLFPLLASLFPFPPASLRAFICPSSLVPYSFATKSFSWVSKEEHVSLILKDKASNLHFLLKQFSCIPHLFILQIYLKSNMYALLHFIFHMTFNLLQLATVLPMTWDPEGYQ